MKDTEGRVEKFPNMLNGESIRNFLRSAHIGMSHKSATTSIIALFAFLVLGERAMPHHFEFDAEQKILLVVMKGHIDGSAIIQIDRDMRAKIQLTKPLVGISDLTRVTGFDVPGEIIRGLARQKPAPFSPETPRFIVASSDLLFGMMRMYELAADRPEGKLTVVRRMEDALAAMGLQTAKFEMLE